jgi:cytochrome P450/NADPH-cytochrome P450 reductase
LAGHETTSGLLSFAFLNLLKNSRAYLKAQKEVDEVVGKGPVQAHHLKNLKYLSAVLRETLRLFPTAPGMTKKVNPEVAHEPAILGGMYKVEPNEAIMVLFGKAQQDPAVYGEDAAEFKPERMLDEEFDKLPKGAWSVRTRPHDHTILSVLTSISLLEMESELALAVLLRGKRL